MLSTSNPLWAAETSLASDTEVSSEGYFVLSWTTMPATETQVSLQQSTTENFSAPREFTLPADGSITITGLEDGRYFFRAAPVGEAFGNTVVVDVVHHSLGRAAFFFVVGLALFIILVVTIVRGNRGLTEGDHG